MIKLNDVYAIKVNKQEYDSFNNWKIEQDGEYFICPSSNWYVKDECVCYEENGRFIFPENAYEFESKITDMLTPEEIQDMCIEY